MTSAVVDRATARPASAATDHAVAFVAEKKPEAEALGRELAELTDDPEGFATALRAGLQALADPDYLEGQRRVAPGIGALEGSVTVPLMEPRYSWARTGGIRKAARQKSESVER